MPQPWPDPRDNEPESRFGKVMVYFIAAVIGAGMIGNLLIGLTGGGWNW